MDAQTLLTTVLALDPQAKARETTSWPNAAKQKVDRPAVEVPAGSLVAFMRKLHDSPELSFDMLYMHTAIDWLAENRFELVYQLYSMKHGHYLLVSTSIPREKPEAPTVSKIWRIAEWHEREVYDMFGVLYDGHGDLRRLLLEDDWTGFPLRKDYKDDFIIQRPQ